MDQRLPFPTIQQTMNAQRDAGVLDDGRHLHAFIDLTSRPQAERLATSRMPLARKVPDDTGFVQVELAIDIWAYNKREALGIRLAAAWQARLTNKAAISRAQSKGVQPPPALRSAIAVGELKR